MACDGSQTSIAHDHCMNCYNKNCEKDGSFIGFGEESCPLTDCPSNCGARFHSCKLLDHEANICSEFSVPCLNRVYGCPQELARKNMAVHLGRCPANSVSCNIQWNRMLAAPSTYKTSNLIRSDLESELANTSDMLDVSLVCRDQRKLDESLKMPRTLLRSLRNVYSTTIPAIPLSSRPQSVPESGDAPNMTDSTDSLNHLLDEEDNSNDKACQFPPGETVSSATQTLPDVHCSLCKSRSCQPESGLARSIHSALNHLHYTTDDDTVEVIRLEKNYALSSEAEEKLSPSNSNPGCCKNKVRSRKPRISLVMEMFNSFKLKPSKMLTFQCCQDFRRDQFPAHYKNVHQDIQAGLDGWMQIRCPLAEYGCSYTTHRFITTCNQSVVYNPAVESFMVKPDIYEAPNNDSVDHLSALPGEVLYLLLTYLDSSSLKSLSLTSKYIRSATSALLPKHGIVILNWKRDENKHWKADQKVWLFTTAFREIESWKFRDVEPVSNHLKECPYFTREDMVKNYDITKGEETLNELDSTHIGRSDDSQGCTDNKTLCFLLLSSIVVLLLSLVLYRYVTVIN